MHVGRRSSYFGVFLKRLCLKYVAHSEAVDIYWQLILCLSVGHKLTPCSAPMPHCILTHPLQGTSALP